MPLRLNIPLPGPFSWSTRVTPDLRKTARQVGRVTRALAHQEGRCPCGHRPPPMRPANPRPQDRTIVHTETGVGTYFLISLVVMVLVILAILGFAGFKL